MKCEDYDATEHAHATLDGSSSESTYVKVCNLFDGSVHDVLALIRQHHLDGVFLLLQGRVSNGVAKRHCVLHARTES